jgi:nucleotide-binding universal stress UspA family protein
MEKDQFILVPWDFTKMADHALMHAVKISRMVDLPVVLLHILERNTSEGELKKLRNALEEAVSNYSSRFGIELSYQLYEGHIFSSITEFANERKAGMVIMGTHGLRGLQKVTGSWALKVIVGTRVPFIVVQDKPTDWGKYKTIVLPVDFKSENKEKLRWAIYMGKYFDSSVHILKQSISDKSMLKKTNTNLNYAIRLLMQNDIDYEIHELPKSGNFAKDILIYAQDMMADLIFLTTSIKTGVASYMLGKSEQYIIANSSKIPVLVVNPGSGEGPVS